MTARRVLLTGATGFLGMELLVRLLGSADTDVIAIVRAADREQAQIRIQEVLGRLFDDPPDAAERVIAVPGDVASPDLGLAAADRRLIETTATSIVHCAASIAFDLAEEEASEINTRGTARMLELAQGASRLERFVHVSTAYVAGDTRGSFGEEELDRGQRFRNSYEWSKFNAEKLVEEAASRLPAVVARPSIVVGDRRSGWTPAFNVIYWPMRAFARGLLTELPVDPEGVLDVVPVDYVADALLHLVEHPEVAGRLALVAGEQAITNAELITLVCERFDRPPPRISATTAMPELQEAHAYLPYFDVATRFDDRVARGWLEPAGIRTSPLADFFDAMIGYAERAHWGKRQLTREAAVAAGAGG